MTEPALLHRPVNWSMVTVVLALCIQTCGIVWWGATLQQRVATLETTVTPLAASTAATNATVARLDERTEAIREGVTRIERRLDGR